VPKEVSVIAGPMFSRKTGELINWLSREEIAGRIIKVFQPEIDKRTVGKIASRIGTNFLATPVKDSHALLEEICKLREENPKKQIVIAIDEAQFFDDELPGVVVYASMELDCKVFIAGLDRDFRGVPFGPMPILLALASEVIKLSAVCTFPDPQTGEPCGEKASETYRSIDGKPASFDDPVILIGDKNEGYEARCAKHSRPLPGSPNLLLYPFDKK
jgi:thymidine kinase